MNYFVQNFKNCKFYLALNFALLCILNPKFLEIVLIVRKIITVLFTFSRNIPQILPIETTGIAGFNFAEMTITLSIIGIIAVNTIPTLYMESQENSIIVALKRDYAVYSNGINHAISENGTPDTWGDSGSTPELSDINQVLSKYFKVIKDCDTGTGCFPDIKYKNLKGIYNETNLNQDTLYTKLKLIDGTSIAVTQWRADCSLNWGDTLELKNVCGLLVLDVNGEKTPNTYGKDFFGFAFTKYGLVPLGSPMQSNAYPFNGFCNLNSNANFKYENGLSCTAWIISKSNMDYLDCKGLNWNGKTTCN